MKKKEKLLEELIGQVEVALCRIEEVLERLELALSKAEERDRDTRAMAQKAFDAFCGAERMTKETLKNLVTPTVVEETLRTSLEKLHTKWLEEARKRELEEAVEEFLFSGESPNRRWDA